MDDAYLFSGVFINHALCWNARRENSAQNPNRLSTFISASRPSALYNAAVHTAVNSCVVSWIPDDQVPNLTNDIVMAVNNPLAGPWATALTPVHPCSSGINLIYPHNRQQKAASVTNLCSYTTLLHGHKEITDRNVSLENPVMY